MPLTRLLDYFLKDHCEILELSNDLLTRESLLTLVSNGSTSFVTKFRVEDSFPNTLHVNFVIFMPLLVLLGLVGDIDEPLPPLQA